MKWFLYVEGFSIRGGFFKRGEAEKQRDRVSVFLFFRSKEARRVFLDAKNFLNIKILHFIQIKTFCPIIFFDKKQLKALFFVENIGELRSSDYYFLDAYDGLELRNSMF